jgi:hypothetical protein
MKTQKHVQIVKDFFAAMGRGDKQGLLALSAEDTDHCRGYGVSSKAPSPHSLMKSPFFLITVYKYIVSPELIL